MIEPIDRLEAADMGAWAASVTVNLLAPTALAHAALPDLVERGGRFVTLSSTAANLPIEGLSAYCVAKAGLHMLVQVLALEAPQVTSLSVQPGPVDTGMHDALRADARSALAPERAQFYHDLRSQDRLRPPDVPGRSVAWLTLAAPPDWSGQEIQHDDPRVLAGAEALLGPLPTTKEQV
jgi:NAD(P)-dependent dehydrogenase (short-subunit alcohol dehydrogenase family)